MKKRVRLSVLEKKDNQFYYQNELFSGLAYNIDPNNGVVKSLSEYKDGTFIGESDDLLSVPNQKNILRIDYDFIESEEDSYGRDIDYYQGEPVTAMTYDFVNGILIDESLNEHGHYNANLYRRWDENGNMVEKVTEDYSYEWFKNGSLKEKNISLDSRTIFSITFFEPNKLQWLHIKKSYSFCEQKMNSVALSKEVHLFGDGIADELLKCLEKKPEFGYLNYLDISNTAISLKAISQLNLASISQLRLTPKFDEPNKPYLDTLKKLKGKYPLCEIHLKDQLIEV